MPKIFVSYKYGDSQVADLGKEFANADGENTARSFVNYIERLFDDSHHIYKGETDDASLEDFTDPTIQTSLGEKIFDSSITIVLLSKAMRENQKESEQWIPWEIAYSLRNKSRDDGKRTSRTNAIIAVVIPDENHLYDHAFIKRSCGVREWQTSSLFKIIGKNMFNNPNSGKKNCGDCSGSHHYDHEHSYITPVKWDDFIADYEKYIAQALTIRNQIDNFDLTKKITD